MVAYTARMGLIKPAGGENVDVAAVNTSYDYLDKFASCIMVNDGVTPANGDLFDGAVVKEKTSGVSWVAQKNIGGTFDKVYLTYPYIFYAFTPVNSYAISGVTYFAFAWNTYYASVAKNSSAAELVGGKWVCPVRGIYTVRSRNSWAQNGTGIRASVLNFSGANDVENTEATNVPSGYGTTGITCTETRLFNVGDTVGNAVYQNSGGALNLNSNFIATMICPVQ